MAAYTSFLEVLTRYYKRPEMLERNEASLEAQTCDDWEQTLLIDNIGRGIGWSVENLGRYASQLTGRYIWILDDDDECIRPTLVAELKEIAGRCDPDVIMLRMDHGPRGVLPEPGFWESKPQLGHIGISAFVVKREVWQANAGAWIPGAYHSDFIFIAAVFAVRPAVYWHNVIASQVQRVSLGKPERIDNAG